MLEKGKADIKSKILKNSAPIVKILVACTVIIILFLNLKGIGPKNVLHNFIVRISNFNLSYDDKMRLNVGREFYDYTLFIKENTPEDAAILIPPQAYPWAQTGNAGYLRYFIFPRKVINGNEFEPGVSLKENKIGYALFLWSDDYPIAGKSSTPGWPKFNLKAEFKLYLLPDGTTKKVYGDFNQEEIRDNKGLRGIIKLKN